MIEKRKFNRIQITFYLTISHDDETIHGHVINISFEGCMTMTDRPVLAGTEYHLAIALPETYDSGERLELNATAVWSGENEESGAHNCGFNFKELTDEKKNVINHLIKAINHQDT